MVKKKTRKRIKIVKSKGISKKIVKRIRRIKNRHPSNKVKDAKVKKLIALAKKKRAKEARRKKKGLFSFLRR